MKRITKTKKKAELKPEDFKTQADHEAAVEESYSQMPIYNVFNFFIGGPNKVVDMKNHVEGKPTQPPY
jgi:hypothetical protein